MLKYTSGESSLEFDSAETESSDKGFFQKISSSYRIEGKAIDFGVFMRNTYRAGLPGLVKSDEGVPKFKVPSRSKSMCYCRTKIR